MVVAIDGPAGVGKSTIAVRTAEKSSFYYLNSGNFYRAVTKAVLETHIDQAKEQDIVDVANECNFNIRDNCLYLNGEPVEEVIHTDLIDNRVSFFSTIPEVRDIVNQNLKRIARCRDVVVEGRDIGTVVFPDAEVKIFLDAHIDIRTRRRFKQGISSLSKEKIKKTIQTRDHSDRNKPVGSLKKAVDALYIDTSHLTIDQVCEKVLSEIRKKQK